MKFLMMMTLVFMSLLVEAKDCDYSVSFPGPTVSVTDITQVVQQSFSISRDNGMTGKCSDYRVFFGKGLSNSYQRKAYSPTGASVNYNLHQNINQNGILKDFSDATSAQEFLPGSIPQTDTNYSRSYFVSVPSVSSQNYPAAGTYQDTVQVNVYGFKPNNSNYTFGTSQNLRVYLVVNQKIEISIVDEGAGHNASSTTKVLDFGFLTINQVKGADVRTFSNTPYQLKISSHNNGKLKHSSGSEVAYELKANGMTVSLGASQGSPVSIGSGTSTGSGSHLYNLKFKITEAVTNKTSGEYQDALTITAIAN